MLALLVAALLPTCPADVTAQPGAAARRAGVKTAWIGRPPVKPCLDADGHLAVPSMRFEIGHPRLKRESLAQLAHVAGWLHAHPAEGLRIHATWPITWIRGARPAFDRGEAIRAHLISLGVDAARVSVSAEDVLIPNDIPGARAKQRAARDLWFERRPYRRPEPIDRGVGRVAAAEGCATSVACRRAGACQPGGDGCVARTDADCAGSQICAQGGACRAIGGTCQARDADCRASARCRVHGLCSVVAFNCGAKSAADCAGSQACAVHGRCRPSPRGDCQR